MATAGLAVLGAGCAATPPVRIATYNVAMHRDRAGSLAADLRTGADAQARAIAEVLQRLAPDIVLLNEFDHDADGAGLAAFRALYLERSQNGAPPLVLPYAFAAPVNTGVASGFDLDRNGRVGGAGDAWGYGAFSGQYGLVVLSKYPIDPDARTFRNFRWRDLPGALLPDDVTTAAPDDWYSAEALAVFPLSSKSHWDVPVRTPQGVVHVLAAHPTPPVFDGAEDRNGRRNHDEIRFWAEYLAPTAEITDDAGRRGGLAADAAFVIAGDLNADPFDGDSTGAPMRALLAHPRVRALPVPAGSGGVEAAQRQGGANATHRGDPAHDTGDFGDGPRGPGNLRVDYVLPSRNLVVVGAGVFWPVVSDALTPALQASDHRPVYIDVRRAPDAAR